MIVEDDEDGGFLIERAITKRFPGAEIRTFSDGDAAAAAAADGPWRGFIVHRSLDVDGIGIVKRLHFLNPHVPIVMISGRDQAAAALAAGATHFVRYADWQTLGTIFEAPELP
jgi:DNA-binding response OmpR family regulator